MTQPNPIDVRYDFTDRVVVMTGAARGQGRSHALAFADAGATVVVSDICGPNAASEYELGTFEELTGVAADIGRTGRPCLAQVCDVRDPNQVTALVAETVEKFGHIDVLVNNAAIDGVAPLADMKLAMWDDMMNTNVRGAFLLAQAVAPAMTASRRGKIINIGSIASFLGLPSRSHYVTAKHALAGLTKALALDLAPQGITVNMVCPGAVRSPMNAVSAMHPGMGQQLAQLTGSWNILEAQPERQLLEPTQISNAVLWLASAAADFVTGATFVIDAGASIK